MEKIKNYIGGKLLEPVNGSFLDNYSPATGEIYSQIPSSDTADVENAIEAAKQAFPKWSTTPASQRAKLLRAIATAIEARLPELAKAETIDNGKPISVSSSVDIPRSALNFEFFADAITQFSSECHVMDETAVNYTLRFPLGVVGCISPWNLPLYLLTWKIAPALAAGNCVVAKPSEVTPMTAFLLSKICIDVGIPPGVLNIVHGTGPKVGAILSSHPEIKAISFTGSTRTGEEIAKVAAPQFKKLSLEMGGKNPNIIFADCNFDEALKTTVRSTFANQGQICLCGSRIFIERPIYEKFKNALVDRAKALIIGDPLEKSTEQGAVVSKEHMNKVLACIEQAKRDGGKILVGGERAQMEGKLKNGWFIQPTLIEGLSNQCQINQEEVFGPVATLIPFDREEEALQWANEVRYGLSSTIWTQDITRAQRVARKIQSGIVWINCWMLRDLRTPFGGMKDSGVGREGGQEALRFFTEPKNICIQS